MAYYEAIKNVEKMNWRRYIQQYYYNCAKHAKKNGK